MPYFSAVVWVHGMPSPGCLIHPKNVESYPCMLATFTYFTGLTFDQFSTLGMNYHLNMGIQISNLLASNFKAYKFFYLIL